MQLTSATASSGSRRARVRAPDGIGIAVDVFEGAGDSAVVVAGATGVPRRFYAPFARHLAGAGHTVVTFDYRGIGGSASPAAREVATMAAWGEQDLSGVLRWVDRELSPRRLAVVAHSVGGQILPLADEARELDAAYLVASQSGHWAKWDGAWRARLWLSWHVLVPAVVPVLGRMPAKLLGGGEDLPAGVALEWARWGRDPRYVLSHRPDVAERFARVEMPLRMISFTDDDMAPPRAVEALLGYYAGAEREHRVVRPEEIGVWSIGHFGYFRERSRDALWPDAVSFLRAHLA
jgi:predicted alpha/beta hydrolase